MAYEVVFPSERVERLFQKVLEKIPADYQKNDRCRGSARQPSHFCSGKSSQNP
jgi:hypothetical protein